jgi:hypothetical protein
LLGIGRASGSLQIGDKSYQGHFQYGGVGTFIGYEYAFLDYFSARIAMNTQVYSGINGRSAIVIGSSVGAGGSLGLTASLPVANTLRVGFLFDAGITPGLALTIGNGIRTIVSECSAGACPTIGTGGIFEAHNAITFQPALAANWAPLSPLGFTANVAFLGVSQRSNLDTLHGQAMSVAAAADFDFLNISPVPIGLQAVFAVTSPIGGNGIQRVSDLGGGLFYTGREHLGLGLQVIARRFAVEPTVNASWGTVIATVGVRYYW